MIDRFAQIEPKLLFACDGYGFGGKDFSRDADVSELRRGPAGAGGACVAACIDAADRPSPCTRWEVMGLPGISRQKEFEFERVAHDHPIWISVLVGNHRPAQGDHA